MVTLPRGSVGLLLCAALAKLLLEAASLCRARDRGHGPPGRSAMLMLTDLRAPTLHRFIFAALGGVVIPAGLLLSAPAGSEIAVGAAGPALLFGCCIAGELLERLLFFAAAPRPRMPGGSP